VKHLSRISSKVFSVKEANQVFVIFAITRTNDLIGKIFGEDQLVGNKSFPADLHNFTLYLRLHPWQLWKAQDKVSDLHF
jgi:hypothetical protein